MHLRSLGFIVRGVLTLVDVVRPYLIFFLVLQMTFLRIEIHSIAQMVLFIGFGNVVVGYRVFEQVYNCFLHVTALM
jgi:hypothetical protein